ncbi:MAG: FAD-dependent oxidoreductase [Actinobacteria bacterium]|nr:FAD-dependent oxidoreductase [Actinomycetota bacterium]
MSRTRVLILGAGFGGLELSTRLSDELADDVEVTLIDQNDWFMFGFSKLDVMFGRKTADEVRLHYRDIAKPGVEFRQETVVSIDPERKRVVTDRGTYETDILVVALGADLDPAATPGLVESGHEFYSPAGAERVREILPTFDGGSIVIAVLGGFFKCPPAPYETAFMLHDYLTKRGVRDASTIHLVTPMPKPIPISDEVSTAIVGLLDDRGIQHSHASRVTALDPARRVAQLDDGRELAYDVFLAVPVHCAPPVVVESGLTENGWIPVDKATLATKFPGVFAVGDVASAPVPRAGVIAEGEAWTVADVLIAQIKGGPAPAPFAGEVICYVEMGDSTIGKVNVNFLSGPSPTAVYTPPSLAGADEKRSFAAHRRRRWFDRDD